MALTDNLVFCIEMNQASGNEVDSHTSGLTISHVNNPGTATGKVGNCRDFEFGSTQYFAIADNPIVSLGADTKFGFVAWVMLESKGGGGGNNEIVCKWDSIADDREYFFDFDDSGTKRFRFAVRGNDNVTNGIVTANTLGEPALSTWYMVAGWHDPVANKCYISVNAQTTPDEVAHSAGTRNSATPLWIGAGQFGGVATPGSLFDGYIDQLLFYKDGFPSLAELTQLFNSNNGMSYAQMVGLDSSLYIPGLMNQAESGGWIGGGLY